LTLNLACVFALGRRERGTENPKPKSKDPKSFNTQARNDSAETATVATSIAVVLPVNKNATNNRVEATRRSFQKANPEGFDLISK
jgi:hypothetical protein